MSSHIVSLEASLTIKFLSKVSYDLQNSSCMGSASLFAFPELSRRQISAHSDTSQFNSEIMTSNK
ncbi:hypothetical protein CSKR_200623, partial [Clonorchis sinensis]